MEEKKKNLKVTDGFFVTVAGKKKRFEIVEREVKDKKIKKGLLYVTIDNNKNGHPQLFRFDVWNEEDIEKISNIPDNSYIRVVSKPHNYDYELEGKKIYSYDLTLEKISAYSGKEYTEFSLAGRLVKDVELANNTGRPCMSLRIACNNGKNPTYATISHYGYSLNLSEFGKKGESISLEGYVVRSTTDGTLSFFATRVWSNNPNISFKKELEN